MVCKPKQFKKIFLDLLSNMQRVMMMIKIMMMRSIKMVLVEPGMLIKALIVIS